MSRPPSCIHNQHCHDAVNGKKYFYIYTTRYWWFMVNVCNSSCISLTVYTLCLLSYKPSHGQIGVTFAIVFGVILYRISTKAALHMSSNPTTRNHAQLTVKTTAAIINLVVILILDEVYGAVARWLTVLGKLGEVWYWLRHSLFCVSGSLLPLTLCLSVGTEFSTHFFIAFFLLLCVSSVCFQVKIHKVS